MVNRDQLVSDIAQEVIARLQIHLNGGASKPASAPSPAPSANDPKRAPLGDGVFATVDEAVKAAAEAQKKVAALSLEERGRMIAAIRRICDQRAEELGKMELEESNIGRLDHKIEKLKIIRNVVGEEAMRVTARSDSTGMCIIERAPWGVIGMVLPATHSVPTMAGNAINIIAAGNAAIFSPHPAASKVAAYALQLFNRAFQKELGINNVITTMSEASIKAAEEVFHHPGVHLLTVTGGPAVVKAASKTGKRVIAAGPGNPPVVVDETADLDLAARCIIKGASFDNNLLCIGEKQVFVVASVFDKFKAAMRVAGAHELDKPAIDRLTKAAFRFDDEGKGCGQAHLKRDLIGKDVSVLAQAAGARVPAAVQLLFGETDANHPFVQEEQMMPFVPVVKVGCIRAAIDASVQSEHGYRHTAVIHSRNIDNVTRMAKAMNTTLFVHNAPSTGALGADGPGYLSYSIATPTGEGVTTPLTFTRERQLAIGAGGLRFI
jgi:aldehyde dehydrogenase